METMIPREGAAQVPRSLDAVYREHVHAIYAFIYGRVGNRETAEDITSEVFIKALAHLDPSREARSVAAWLYRVARNAVADYWRGAGGALVITLDEARAYRTVRGAHDTSRQEQTAERAALVLGQLPDNYRTVLSYRLLQGLSVTETAARMGTTEGNVKVLQHRALKRAAELRGGTP